MIGCFNHEPQPLSLGALETPLAVSPVTWPFHLLVGAIPKDCGHHGNFRGHIESAERNRSSANHNLSHQTELGSCFGEFTSYPTVWNELTWPKTIVFQPNTVLHVQEEIRCNRLWTLAKLCESQALQHLAYKTMTVSQMTQRKQTTQAQPYLVTSIRTQGSQWQ